MKAEFGNLEQMKLIEHLKETEIVTDNDSRRGSRNYYDRNFPDILYRRNFNAENLKWTCPLCNVDNFVRVHIYSTEFYQPVITPRVYFCHNSRCHMRRFYWRDEKNTLLARFVSKGEGLNELDFISRFDPIKFYANLKPSESLFQNSLF